MSIATDVTRTDQNLHALPDAWLGARMRGWMFDEAKGSHWWICAIQADGKFRYASFPEDAAMHNDWREHARKVCRHMNKHASLGGAWLCGYIGQMFYMLWKDADGDIQIPVEFGADGVPMPLSRFLEHGMDDFLEHGLQAHAVWKEHQYRIDHSKNQRRALAQGDRVSAEHAEEAAKYVIMPDQIQ